LSIFNDVESSVRSYCRSFPTTFEKASGYRMWDQDGREFLDFFAGAGTLNYGHNPDDMKWALIRYLTNDGVAHGLDMQTGAKARFLQKFKDVILEPRGMDHKVLFPGPTGTNAVETAIKAARIAKGRDKVVSFTNAFHGMTLGSLSLTGNAMKREGAGMSLGGDVIRMPFCGYMDDEMDTIDYFERTLGDPGSGIDHPAAVIVETIQGEGGINVAEYDWLQRLEGVCRKYDMVFIVDDIQVGCGRTGTFFSFEHAGISPDIICLSKSLSGFGLPMAVVLLKPDCDVFEPGQHNGTFRGNNLAFVTATQALDRWTNKNFENHINGIAKAMEAKLKSIIADFPALKGYHKGRGMMQGISIEPAELASEISAAAFERGLLIETAGAYDEVVKLLPPLVLDAKGLDKGISILHDSFAYVTEKHGLDGSKNTSNVLDIKSRANDKRSSA